MTKTKCKTLPNPIFESSDLFLSAFLKSRNLKLQGVRKIGEKTIFIFRDTGNRPGLVADFFNDAPVGVTSFRSALQDLKSLIFGG